MEDEVIMANEQEFNASVSLLCDDEQPTDNKEPDNDDEDIDLQQQEQQQQQQRTSNVQSTDSITTFKQTATKFIDIYKRKVFNNI